MADTEYTPPAPLLEALCAYEAFRRLGFGPDDLHAVFGDGPDGKLRKYGRSFYQCFRRGNHYLWVGHRFIERPGPGFPVTDFVSDGPLNVLRVLN